jgi:DUF971 family protein
MSTPKHIRALRDEGVLEVEWPDGTVRYPFKLLREECRCALCVDENTGRRILDPADVPESIRPTNAGFSGNYALKIAWSDGHNTGLYTWDHLRELITNPHVEWV